MSISFSDCRSNTHTFFFFFLSLSLSLYLPLSVSIALALFFSLSLSLSLSLCLFFSLSLSLYLSRSRPLSLSVSLSLSLSIRVTVIWAIFTEAHHAYPRSDKLLAAAQRCPSASGKADAWPPHSGAVVSCCHSNLQSSSKSLHVQFMKYWLTVIVRTSFNVMCKPGAL